MLPPCIAPHQILKSPLPPLQHLCKTLYMLRFSIALYFWQFLGCLGTFILTAVLSIKFFRYTVLDFLSLALPRTYSLSLECSRRNASPTFNSINIRASEELGYFSWFPAVLLVFLKYEIIVFSRIPCVFPFF